VYISYHRYGVSPDESYTLNLSFQLAGDYTISCVFNGRHRIEARPPRSIHLCNRGPPSYPFSATRLISLFSDLLASSVALLSNPSTEQTRELPRTRIRRRISRYVDSKLSAKHRCARLLFQTFATSAAAPAAPKVAQSFVCGPPRPIAAGFH
jgi:hypothetical protein